MSEYQYISIPISYLEKNNISKQSFMQNSHKSREFVTNLCNTLPKYIELKNTFLVNTNFILAFGKKQNIIFENSNNFNMFCNFLQNTKFKNIISINKSKKEISIPKDIPPLFYNILHEFLI